MSRLRRWWWAAGLAVSLLVVVAAAYVASADPDGLERVAEDLGFGDRGQGTPWGVLPDYAIPGLEGPASTILAGVLGVAIVFALMLLAGRLLARRRSRPE